MTFSTRIAAWRFRLWRYFIICRIKILFFLTILWSNHMKHVCDIPLIIYKCVYILYYIFSATSYNFAQVLFAFLTFRRPNVDRLNGGCKTCVCEYESLIELSWLNEREHIENEICKSCYQTYVHPLSLSKIWLSDYLYESTIFNLLQF